MVRFVSEVFVGLMLSAAIAVALAIGLVLVSDAQIIMWVAQMR